MTRLLCLVFLLALVACGSGESWPHERFNEQKWRELPEGERYPLVHDLVDRRLLIGLTRVQVEQMLGKPGFVDPAGTYVTYVVKLGGQGFDQVFLLDIRFDHSTGRSVNSLIRGD